MKTKTLSPEHERQLITSIKLAVSLVDDDDLSPDAAIEKVAREEKWGHDMIRFAAQAYNTGRQTAQRTSGDSILDKVAEFPLSDPDKVIEAIWPANVKAAVDVQQTTGVSAEYDKPPGWIAQQQRVWYMGHVKAASADLNLGEGPPPYQPDPVEAMKKAHSQFIDLRRAEETARHYTALAKEKIIGAMGKVGAYFKHPHYAEQFDTVLKVAEEYGYGSTEAIDMLHRFVVRRNRMGKTAMDEGGKPSFTVAIRDTKIDLCGVEVDHDAAPYSLVKACFDAVNDFQEKNAAHKAASDAKQAHVEGDMRPFVQAPPRPQSNGFFPVDAPVEKRAIGAGFLGGALVGAETKGILESALADPTTEKLEAKQLEELDDPGHQANMRRIQAQALLSEMMTDPVIGGHDPNDVSQAYNELSKMAPRAALQPVTMRALLRRHLQGEIEPFESKEITDIEKGLLQTQEPTSPASIMDKASNAIF